MQELPDGWSYTAFLFEDLDSMNRRLPPEYGTFALDINNPIEVELTADTAETDGE